MWQPGSYADNGTFMNALHKPFKRNPFCLEVSACGGNIYLQDNVVKVIMKDLYSNFYI